MTLLLLCALIGCGAPKVVIPKPRAVTDEDEGADHRARSHRRRRATGCGQRSLVPKPNTYCRKTDHSRRRHGVRRARSHHFGHDRAGNPQQTLAVITKVPSRPADFSAWTHDDFRAAKADRDGRLVKAVSALGQPTGDANANARLLVALLDPPAPVASAAAIDSEDGDVPSPTPVIRGLPQAIVAARAANRSPVANTALKEILLGKLRTNLDDRTFTLAALAALINNANRRIRGDYLCRAHGARSHPPRGPRRFRGRRLAARVPGPCAQSGFGAVAQSLG